MKVFCLNILLPLVKMKKDTEMFSLRLLIGLDFLGGVECLLVRLTYVSWVGCRGIIQLSEPPALL